MPAFELGVVALQSLSPLLRQPTFVERMDLPPEQGDLVVWQPFRVVGVSGASAHAGRLSLG